MLVLNAAAVGEKPDALYETLIGRIADGDKNALSALYGHTKNIVYGFALSIVRNVPDAEDVLQDTYISLYSSARNYTRMGKPMAWVLTITRNLALMKIRRRKQAAVVPEEEWRLFTAEEAPVTSEDKLVLTAALRQISPEESQIIMLHAVAGFKHREIADILDMRLSTVLSKYNRGIKKLKSVLDGGNIHAE